ncbi:MAG: EAL domain-containing protein, partial [Longicatena sp.]
TQYLNRVFKMTDFKGKGYSYICDASGNIITRPDIKDKINVGSNLITYFSKDNKNPKVTQEMVENVKNKKSGNTIVKIDGEQKYLNYQPLELKDWYVYSITSSDVLDTQLNTLLDNVYLYSFIIIITFFLLITFVIYVINYQNKKSKKALQTMAYYDDITKGPNKNLFEIKARKLLDENATTYAYVILNVNRFKVVNDIFGYTKGNYLLTHMMRVLQTNCTENETYGRFYSDNFHLLLTYGNVMELQTRLLNISKQICSFEIDANIAHALSLALGVMLVEHNKDDISSLGDKAKMALSLSKGNHETTIHFYDTKIIERLLNEQEIENTMKDALDNHEMQIFLQPKILINTKQPIMKGSEALVRWQRNGKTIMPNDFIPLFERNGFVKELDMYMVEQACRTLRDWKEKGVVLLPISINQARTTLYAPNYIESLLAILKKYDVDPVYIEIEITERMFFEDVDTLIAINDELHKHGFNIAMDDFGSGYSSLNMLQDIHVDVIKIDKNFFNDSVNSQRGKIIVKNIVSMAKELSMDVVAEGIETSEQIALCKELNCDCIQGYYFSKAVSINEYERLLNKYSE